MSLPVIFSKVASVAKSIAGNGVFLAKKYAPEIMISGGIAGFGATIFATVKATNKTNDIVEERELTLKTIEDMHENCDEDQYSDEVYENDIKETNRHAKWEIAKAWTPVVTLGGASVISILGGYRVLNGRYVATAAACKLAESTLDRYRNNVVERFGKDTDYEMLHSIKAEELAKARDEQAANKEIDADNKRKKFGKKRKKTEYAGIYNGIFDEYSDRWQRYWTGEQVLHYLKTKQNELNDMLKIRKHLFVNEVYDALGFERTPEGQVSGWIITKSSPDSYVSLGIDEMPEEELRQILCTHRNEDIRVKIRLNPMGVIYNMIDKRDYLRD